MKKILCILFVILFFSSSMFAEEICETSNLEIIIDLGGDSKPEKIIYRRDTICEGSWMYCGSGGCSLDVFDDKDNQVLGGYLSQNTWYIRPSESNYSKPTENAFELVIPMAKSYCSENHGNENCSIVVKVINNQLTEIIEINQ